MKLSTVVFAIRQSRVCLFIEIKQSPFAKGRSNLPENNSLSQLCKMFTSIPETFQKQCFSASFNSIQTHPRKHFLPCVSRLNVNIVARCQSRTRECSSAILCSTICMPCIKSQNSIHHRCLCKS